MKKILLQTGIITIGSLALFSEPLKVYASDEQIEVQKYDYSKVLDLKDQKEKEIIIRKYARIYELDEDTIVNKIKSLTNDLTELEIVNVTLNENLSNYEMSIEYGIGEDGYQNEELALFYTVRDISRNPEKYNLNSEDIIGEKYKNDRCYETILKEACELFNINPAIALSISCHECGVDLGSSNFRNNNNPAGLGPHNYYKNIAVGVYEYAIVLKEGYHCTKDSDASFFDRIGHVYCQDGSDWAGTVKSFYYNIENDYYYYAEIYGRIGKTKKKKM